VILSTSKVIFLDDEILLSQLEDPANNLGIVVRRENINLEEASTAGGLCRMRGEYFLILNTRATVKEKIRTAIEALRHFDLTGIYIKPVIRELLNGDEWE
jgi:hypothetical protein